MARKKQFYHLAIDLALIIISLVAAVFLVKTGFLTVILAPMEKFNYLMSFIAGLLFSSIFTVAPSVVLISELAKYDSIIITAFLGGLGALVSDLLIFEFIKDRISADIGYLTSKTKFEKIIHIFQRRLFRWLLPFIGALIIASPLPDELGIAIMGLSKTKTSLFILLSFLLNFFGILIIAAIAQNIF